MDQRQAPLLDALQRYVQQGRTLFHTPGHRQGRGAEAEWRRLMGSSALQLDLTEAPGLDDLHAPSGPIRAAQELAAAAFGADRSYFLVGGATVGVQALVLALAPAGRALLLARGAHRSALAGLILSGGQPVWLRTGYHRDLDLGLGVPVAELQRALAATPTAAAVLLVDPTYHGVCGPLPELVAAAHRHNIPVVVDAAHGAHLGFHPDLPTAALAAGADAVVHSLHKIGGALGQAALLHLQAGRVDARRVEAMLRLLQSSSPSYLLLASLDAARREWALHGHRHAEHMLELAAAARRLVDAAGFSALTAAALADEAGCAGLDPGKLVVDVRPYLSGYRAATTLAQQGVVPEMAGAAYVLCMLSHADDHDALAALARALAALPRGTGAEAPVLGPPPWPEVMMAPRTAALSRSQATPLTEAVGAVAAEWIAPYPPGIPVVCPGERITPAVVSYLQQARQCGHPLQGPSDPTLNTIQTVRE